MDEYNSKVIITQWLWYANLICFKHCHHCHNRQLHYNHYDNV